MTQERLDEIIQEAGPLARKALGDIRDGIIEAAKAKLEEASEKDNDSDKQGPIKLAIPLRLIIRLDQDPPTVSVEASTARQWKSEAGEILAPKSGAERQREYRLRHPAGQ